MDKYQKASVTGGATSVSDFKIKDLKTFDDITGDPHQVGGLYFYLMLDCLVDIAHKVSYDFFKRPELYLDLQSLTIPIPPLLAELHARYGSSESLPNTEQRNEIYKPIFGRIAGYSPQEEDDFPRLRDDLIHAAAAFAESTAADAAQMLLGSFKDTIRPFQQYLVGLQGDSVKWSRENALPHLTEEVSYTILRSTGIASIFGTGKPPVNEWPYTEDTLGDKLVEAISKQLTWTDKPDEMTLTRDHFSNLQRVGLRGAEAIATIIDFQDGIADNDLKLIIGKVYTWGVALKSLSNQVAPGQPTPAEEKSRLAVHHTELYRAI